MEIVWLVVGIIATAIVSHYYFRRTVRKTLSFFVLLNNRVLAGIDPQLRNSLQFSFSGREPPPSQAAASNSSQTAAPPELVSVTDLQQVHLILANTAERAISFHEPPRFNIGPNSRVLDASVLYQNPQEMNASVHLLPASDEMQGIVATAPLLNKGDYFIVKLLLDGYIDVDKLALHLLADDLPRTIHVRPLPAESTRSLWEAINWFAVWVGVLMMAVALATGDFSNTVADQYPLPSLSDATIKEFLSALKFVHLELIAAFLSAVVVFLSGLAITFGIGVQALMQRHRIVLPKEFRP